MPREPETAARPAPQPDAYQKAKQTHADARRSRRATHDLAMSMAMEGRLEDARQVEGICRALGAIEYDAALRLNEKRSLRPPHKG